MKHFAMLMLHYTAIIKISMFCISKYYIFIIIIVLNTKKLLCGDAFAMMGETTANIYFDIFLNIYI